MVSKRHGSYGVMTGVILMGLLSVTIGACSSAGAGDTGGGSAGSIASYPSIPGSVLGATGGSGVTPSVFRSRNIAASYLGQAELLAEYGEFMAVPETGMNYNDSLEQAHPLFAEWAETYYSGTGDWRESDAPYDVEMDFALGPQVGIFRATDDFSHYEAVLHGSDGTRFHYEVQQYAAYTHGFMYAYLTSGDAAVDTVEIISTDAWTFTKVVRIFNLDGTMDVNDDGSADDYAVIDVFAMANRNDAHQRVLGVKRRGFYTLPADLSTATYAPSSWDEQRVGAFDSVQLAIRPDTRPASPAPELWGSTYPDEHFSAQGETFDHTLFPSESDVRLLLDVGIDNELVGQWVINADLSRNYDSPEWDPSSISFSGIIP